MISITPTNQINKKKIGVLLINLGTPKSPNKLDVFQYLNEFLTDPRVIDKPWLKRQLLVRGLIVPFRYRQSAEQYSHLWTNEGPPLLVHGLNVKNKLKKALGDTFQVELGMRYQQPSIAKALETLRKYHPDELIILPLFPQYASATTGSVIQKVMESIKKWTIFPKLVFINHFYDQPGLINAFCARAEQYPLASFDHILFSFHGLPEKQIRECDPSGKCLSPSCCQRINSNNSSCYVAQCKTTARAIASQLQLNDNTFTICFQSRLGKEPWLQPYLSDVIQDCARKGRKKILVFSPSFVCDCLETSCEISIEYAREFKNLGGESLQLVEGLNDHPLWIDALKDLVNSH